MIFALRRRGGGRSFSLRRNKERRRRAIVEQSLLSRRGGRSKRICTSPSSLFSRPLCPTPRPAPACSLPLYTMLRPMTPRRRERERSPSQLRKDDAEGKKSTANLKNKPMMMSVRRCPVSCTCQHCQKFGELPRSSLIPSLLASL